MNNRILAHAALTQTDKVFRRIVEAVAAGETTFTAPDVVAYVEYSRKLRAVAGGAESELPKAPAYPKGT